MLGSKELTAFYKKKSEDVTLNEKEREQYRKHYLKLARAGGLEDIKREMATNSVEVVDVEYDDCDGGGCKI